MTPTESIKIQGEEYPFHFGVGASKLFGIKTGNGNVKVKDMGVLFADSKLEDLDVLLWCGLKSGAAKAEGKFDKTIDEVRQMVEDDPFALDQAFELVTKIEEEYSEDVEGNPQKAKSKK